jgi:purine-binding chemotaxis protein CheW
MQALASEAYDDLQDDLYLTFTIDREVFGIGIDIVKEIIGIQPVTVIPDFPEHVKGIINLRGKIIPVMDVRLRFKRAAQAYDARTCIIVVEILGASVGLIVDRVAEVAAIPDADISSPPELGKRENGYIKGFGKTGGGIVLLLDCGALLKNEAEITMLAKENGR